MCNFLCTLQLGVSLSFFNKKSDEFGQLYNAELLNQKKKMKLCCLPSYATIMQKSNDEQ